MLAIAELAAPSLDVELVSQLAGAELAALEPSRHERRDDLVRGNLRLVRHIVRRIAARVPAHVDGDELMAAGYEGLLRAADRFDPDRGVAFSTFAACAIRGAVMDALRDMDPLARPTRQRVQAVERAEADLAQRYGGAVPPEALAAQLGLTEDDVLDALHMRRAADAVSIDDERGDGTLRHLLADPKTEDAAGRLLLEEAIAIVREEVLELPEADRRVILLYYGDGLLLREIAKLLRVTEGRICQIHKRAIDRLRAAVQRRGLMD